MQRHSHKLLMAVLAVLLVLAASEAVAGGHPHDGYGFDPGKSVGANHSLSTFRRAEAACLDARGYSLKYSLLTVHSAARQRSVHVSRREHVLPVAGLP